MDIQGRDFSDPIAPIMPDGFDDTAGDPGAFPNESVLASSPEGIERPTSLAARRGNLVMVMEDHPTLSVQLGAICNYVGLTVEAVSSIADLALLLDERRPLAVIAPFETEHQDGGHVLKSVAMHDRDLPVMLLAGNNPVYLGAAEALREVLHLTAVSLPVGEPTLGQMVEFLARASQRNRRRRGLPMSDIGAAAD